MNPEMERICFLMIADGGDARTMVFKALELGKEGNFAKAREVLEKSREPMTRIHKLQTQLLQKEARGELASNSILLVHAQDILMAVATERDLAEFIISSFEKIEELKT